MGERCKLPQWGPGRSPGDLAISADVMDKFIIISMRISIFHVLKIMKIGCFDRVIQKIKGKLFEHCVV